MDSKYGTLEADALLQNLKFEMLPTASRRAKIREEAKRLLIALDNLMKTHLNISAGESGETNFTWEVTGGYIISVAIDSGPEKIVAHAQRHDRPGRDRSVVLAYNSATETLESVSEETFSTPGIRPAKRSALTVIVEALCALMTASN